MSDGGDCRTAPATPGLLIMSGNVGGELVSKMGRKIGARMQKRQDKVTPLMTDPATC